MKFFKKNPKIPRSFYEFSSFPSLLLFHARQAAEDPYSAEASKRAQCTSPGQYTPYVKGRVKTP